MLGEEQRVLAVDVAGCVDGAALGWGFLDEAVGAEQAAGSEHSPGAAVGLEQQAGVVGSFAAVAGTEFGLPGCWTDGNDVDDAADGAGTIEIAGAAADQFDALDGELGLLLPVNPSADGVVEGHIVVGNKRAAGGGGTEAAQADALRCGVGDERTGAAEELEAGNLADLAVEGDGRRVAESALREQPRGGGAFKRAERSAVGGDGDGGGDCGCGRGGLAAKRRRRPAAPGPGRDAKDRFGWGTTASISLPVTGDKGS